MLKRGTQGDPGIPVLPKLHTAGSYNQPYYWGKRAQPHVLNAMYGHGRQDCSTEYLVHAKIKRYLPVCAHQRLPNDRGFRLDHVHSTFGAGSRSSGTKYLGMYSTSTTPDLKYPSQVHQARHSRSRTANKPCELRYLRMVRSRKRTEADHLTTCKIAISSSRRSGRRYGPHSRLLAGRPASTSDRTKLLMTTEMRGFDGPNRMSMVPLRSECEDIPSLQCTAQPRLAKH